MTAKEYYPWMRVHTTNRCEGMPRVRKTDPNLDCETCPGYLQRRKSNEQTRESEQQDSSRNQESDPQLLKFNEMVEKQAKQPPGEMIPGYEHWAKCQLQFPDRAVHGFLLYPPNHPYSQQKVREAKLGNGTQQNALQKMNTQRKRRPLKMGHKGEMGEKPTMQLKQTFRNEHNPSNTERPNGHLRFQTKRAKKVQARRNPTHSGTKNIST